MATCTECGEKAQVRMGPRGVLVAYCLDQHCLSNLLCPLCKAPSRQFIPGEAAWPSNAPDGFPVAARPRRVCQHFPACRGRVYGDGLTAGDWTVAEPDDLCPECGDTPAFYGTARQSSFLVDGTEFLVKDFEVTCGRGHSYVATYPHGG